MYLCICDLSTEYGNSQRHQRGQAMVIYLWIMAVGYLTFGTAAEGLILNNYSEKAPVTGRGG